MLHDSKPERLAAAVQPLTDEQWREVVKKLKLELPTAFRADFEKLRFQYRQRLTEFAALKRGVRCKLVWETRESDTGALRRRRRGEERRG